MRAIEIIGGSLGNTIDLGGIQEAEFSAVGQVSVRGEEGDDSIIGSELGDAYQTLYGGGGADTVLGGSDREIIRAGPGADTVEAGGGGDQVVGDEGNDDLDGGPGGDVLDGGLGSDAISGGADADVVTYGEATGNTEITLDDLPGDGQLGENDNVGSDVENVQGGSWSDHIVGSDADNLLGGGLGADHLVGGGGDDRLYGAGLLEGGADDDLLVPMASGTTLRGGSGTDRADYSSSWSNVIITLDGVANDGSSGTDNVEPDNEEVVGGAGDDVLIGTDEADLLDGDRGNDVLLGKFGADDLVGGDGFDLVSYFDHDEGVTATLDGIDGDGAAGENDWIAADVEDLAGGAGSDRLVGNAAENFLFGDEGNDVLDPLGGADYVFGEAGDDSISVRDGVVDQVECGTERDVVTADSADTTAADCEVVDRSNAPPPPPPPPPAPPPASPPPPPPPPQPQPQPRPPTRARCVVPNLRGKTLREARRLLASKRCGLGKVKRAFSRRVKAGRVIAQSPRPGVRLPRAAKVNVLVSRGKLRRR